MLHTVPGTDQNIVDMTLALECSHSGERDTCSNQHQNTHTHVWVCIVLCNLTGKRWVSQELLQLRIFKRLHPADVGSQLILYPEKLVSKVADGWHSGRAANSLWPPSGSCRGHSESCSRSVCFSVATRSHSLRPST